MHYFTFPEMAGRGAVAPLATPLNPPLICKNLPDDTVNTNEFKSKLYVIIVIAIIIIINYIPVYSYS